MWKPWQLATSSQERAVANARAAATELSRARVERAEVETYLARRALEQPRRAREARRPAAGERPA